MDNFCCTKCGSINVFIDDRGNQKALMCNDCQSWIKWVSKKALPFAKKFIEENKQSNTNKSEWEEIADIRQNAIDKKCLDEEQVKNMTYKVIQRIRNKKQAKELTKDKEEILKSHMGTVSSENIDLNKVRWEYKYNQREIQKPDLYDFMSMVKDILVQIDDDKLDIAATNLKNTIDDLVKMEKSYASIGLRVRKTLNEIVHKEE